MQTDVAVAVGAAPHLHLEAAKVGHLAAGVVARVERVALEDLHAQVDRSLDERRCLRRQGRHGNRGRHGNGRRIGRSGRRRAETEDESGHGDEGRTHGFEGTRAGRAGVPVSDDVRDAATVIVARETAEGLAVFMVRRDAGAVFLPDRYVFPGGAVDPADRELARSRLRGSAGAVDPAYALTAARETFEEVGLLFADRIVAFADVVAARRALLAGESTFGGVLERLNVAVDASRLRYFSRWITPKAEFAPRRYDARFFIARSPADQVAEADAAEVHDGRWFAPLDALAAHERGEIGLIFPTIKHLERIAPYRTVDELMTFAATKSIAVVTPNVDEDAAFSFPEGLESAW